MRSRLTVARKTWQDDKTGWHLINLGCNYYLQSPVYSQQPIRNIDTAIRPPKLIIMGRVIRGLTQRTCLECHGCFVLILALRWYFHAVPKDCMVQWQDPSVLRLSPIGSHSFFFFFYNIYLSCTIWSDMVLEGCDHMRATSRVVVQSSK